MSGHWEERHFTGHCGERPCLYSDYYNFPPHTYELRWDAPAAPDVARSAARLLRKAGFSTGEEITRGWDHGVFVPMNVALPDAEIPLTLPSLRGAINLADHIRAGRAMAQPPDAGGAIGG